MCSSSMYVVECVAIIYLTNNEIVARAHTSPLVATSYECVEQGVRLKAASSWYRICFGD